MLLLVLTDFQISLSLFKKPLDDFADDNFILLATVINGVLQISSQKSLFGGDSGYNNVGSILLQEELLMNLDITM